MTIYIYSVIYCYVMICDVSIKNPILPPNDPQRTLVASQPRAPGSECPRPVAGLALAVPVAPRASWKERSHGRSSMANDGDMNQNTWIIVD